VLLVCGVVVPLLNLILMGPSAMLLISGTTERFRSVILGYEMVKVASGLVVVASIGVILVNNAPSARCIPALVGYAMTQGILSAVLVRQRAHLEREVTQVKQEKSAMVDNLFANSSQSARSPRRISRRPNSAMSMPNVVVAE
jgi:hypothetical protein